MKKLFNVIYKKLTLGLLLSTILSFSFAVILRYLFVCYLDTDPIRGGLDQVDIFYFFIVAILRLVFVACFEYLLEEKYIFPIFSLLKKQEIAPKSSGSLSDFINDKKKMDICNDNKPAFKSNTLMMDKNVDKSSSKSSDIIQKKIKSQGSSSNPNVYSSNSKGNINPFNSSSSKEETGIINKKEKILPVSHDTGTKKMTAQELRDAQPGIFENFDTQKAMIDKLKEIKKSHDITLYLDKEGGLDIEAPARISDNDLEDISKKVGVIDRILNSKFTELKNLDKRMRESDEGWADVFVNETKHYRKEYNDLFEK